MRVLDLSPQLIYVGRGRYQLSSNPDMGYRPAPGAKNMSAQLGWDYPDAETNRSGFRSPQYSREKGPSVFRTVLIGDSLSMGLWIDRFEDTFAAKVEKHIRDFLAPRGIRAELLNFGVTGYNTKQEVAMLEDEALPYNPDFILLEYCLNDSYRNDDDLYKQLLRESRDRVGAPSSLTLHPILAKSALVRFFYFRVASLLKWTGTRTDKETEAKLEHLSRDSTEESFRRLGEISKKIRVPVLVVIFPDFRLFTEDGLKSERDRVADFARREGLAVLDLMPAFLACAAASPEKLYVDGYHPTVPGHACAGKAIGEFVQARLDITNGVSAAFER